MIAKAIEKHGSANFVKQILAVFDTDEEASSFESYIVTKTFVDSPTTYNMHEGGKGGFCHVNDGSDEHRERARKAAKLSSSKNHPNWGKYKFGDNQRLSPEELLKAKMKAKIAKKMDMVNNPEKYKQIYKRISEIQTENNNMKGRCWCVPIGSNDFALDRKAFPVDNIPEGWISFNELRDNKKKKTGTYSKFWIYNADLRQNKYWNGRIPDGWFIGRKMEYYQRTVG